jgi:hypothetical protein
MAQVVERLTSKCKTLSSNYNTTKKKFIAYQKWAYLDSKHTILIQCRGFSSVLGSFLVAVTKHLP